MTGAEPAPVGDEVMLHDFVWAPNELGLGQVSAVDDHEVEVTYFDSVVTPIAERATFDRAVLRWAILEPGRRCYIDEDGFLRPARIEARQGVRYRVVLGSGREVWADPADLRVRWDRLLQPVNDDLIAPATWSHPAEVELRRDYLDKCAEQHRAARGLTAAASVVAELHAHQLEIARRVLDDPVGRFLLADEVGLGKTIETLFVVRQFLVDDPEATIRIVVPRHLIAQWRQELLNRVLVDADGGGAGDFPHAYVQVLERESTLAWQQNEDLDLLVVDEAHGVAAWAGSSAKADRQTYDQAQRLAETARCVLLLSATPSLHSPRTFLALLHLLDPSRHDLRKFDEFLDKLARREEIGSALLGLDAEDPAPIVADALRDLAQALPGVSTTAVELDTFAGELDQSDDLDPSERARLERLRYEVAESFRVDRRMLRTRRALVQKRFPVRGRAKAASLNLDASAYARADDWFERWRAAFVADHATALDGTHEWLAEQFAHAAMYTPGLLAPLARFRSGQPEPDDRTILDLRPAQATMVRAVSIGPEEAHVLAHLPELSSVLGDDLADQLAERIWHDYRARDRIVVMAGHEAAATEIADALAPLVREGETRLHLHSFTARDLAESAARFDNPDDPCHILICDRSAEEGLNLQAADVVVLTDLPLAANQIEQRLGRADRFGHGDPVQLVLVDVGQEAYLRDAWHTLLTTAYRIFDRSTAALQVPVAETLPWLRRALLIGGSATLADLQPRITDHLATGEQELARSDLLDSVWTDDEGKEIAAGLTHFDSHWTSWKHCADKLIGKSLELIVWHHDDELNSYWLSHERRRGTPKIDGQIRASYFVDAVSHSGQERRSTFDRTVALSRPRVRLLRAGDNLVDAVERYLLERHDERVATIWRRTQRLPGDRPHLGFVFHFRTRVELAAGAEQLAPEQRARVMRRLELVLPPAVLTLAVTEEGAVLDEDDDLAFLLTLPYDPEHDKVLTGKASAMARRLAVGNWETVVERACGAGLEVARQQTGVNNVDALLAEAEIARQGRLGVLRARQATDEVTERDRTEADSLVAALQTADVRLEGALILAISPDAAPRGSQSP